MFSHAESIPFAIFHGKQHKICTFAKVMQYLAGHFPRRSGAKRGFLGNSWLSGSLCLDVSPMSLMPSEPGSNDFVVYFDGYEPIRDWSFDLVQRIIGTRGCGVILGQTGGSLAPGPEGFAG